MPNNQLRDGPMYATEAARELADYLGNVAIQIRATYLDPPDPDLVEQFKDQPEVLGKILALRPKLHTEPNLHADPVRDEGWLRNLADALEAACDMLHYGEAAAVAWYKGRERIVSQTFGVVTLMQIEDIPNLPEGER